MADNFTGLDADGNPVTLAGDDIGAVYWQRVKVAHGADGAAVDASADNPLPVALLPASFSDASGEIAVGGTAQELVPANADRRSLLVQNTSANDLRVSLVGNASVSAGILLAPGEGLQFPVGMAPVGSVSIWGGTTGQTFTAYSA